jgi:tetratricopeptide (TPR) repeat protein
MDLTVNQKLHQGVAAHNEGRLKDAERFYRIILKAQPMHPDANHNLGVIAASLGKPELAIPLFKIAAEVSPATAQFCFSYIDALIKVKQFKRATQVIKKAKKAGCSVNDLSALNAQLTQAMQGHTKGKLLPLNTPPQADIDSMLANYHGGQYDRAGDLALSITQQFPEHTISWQVLGLAAEQAEQMEKALIAHQQAVYLDPKNAVSHSNLGNVLRELGRLLEAEVSCRQAIKLQPDFAEAHNNLGNALTELVRLNEAEVSYSQAITLKPDYAAAHSNLGVTLQRLGRLKQAEVSCRQAIALQPDYAKAYSNLGNTLEEFGLLLDAEACFRHAIALQPDFVEAIYDLGKLLYVRGQFENAAEQFTLIDFGASKCYLLRCLYWLGQQSNFYEQLDFLINQGVNNAIVGSLISRSEVRYGINKSNPFCNDPLKYVVKINLTELCDFKTLFIRGATDILSNVNVQHKSQGLLTNGIQTAGNVFSQGGSVTKEIEKIIRLEIEKYRVKFTDSEEGLITSWPKDYNISGWLVSMKSGGELQPHMHEDGWISGSVYINVPAKSKSDSGNLVVCIEDEHLTSENKNQLKSIDVVTGSLCLFPSSLLHYTIPFEADEERIVLAFDVNPVTP